MRNRNQVILPLNLGIKIENNDPVRTLVQICDSFDYTKLFSSYFKSWRKVNPITMFELVVFGYMNRIYSTRELERACKTDIRFMWILQDKPVPNHTTFARFQDYRLAPIIEDLFYQLCNKLFELEEISYANIFIDGTKIEANANRYTFVWAKSVEKFRDKLLKRMSVHLDHLIAKYSMIETTTPEQVLSHIKRLASLQGIRFVKGTGRRKHELQKDYESIENYANKLENYEKSFKICEKRKSYSKTDHDATFMRMK